MPSYHPKKSNPSLIFMLGGDEDDHIIINVDMTVDMIADMPSVLDTHLDKYKHKSYTFINKLIIFIKTIFLF